MWPSLGRDPVGTTKPSSSAPWLPVAYRSPADKPGEHGSGSTITARAIVAPTSAVRRVAALSGRLGRLVAPNGMCPTGAERNTGIRCPEMQIVSSGVLGLEDQDVCEERREEPNQVLLALELVLVVTELVNACQCGDGVTTKNPFWSEAIFYAPHDDRDLQLREMLDGSVPNNVVVL